MPATKPNACLRQANRAVCPPEILKRAVMRLTQLHAAVEVDDLRMPPSNRLEALTGDLAGKWSIRVNDRWRLCFRFEHGHAFDVEIVDYH